MQCATCQHEFDADLSDDLPATCPACGAEIAPAGVLAEPAEATAVATAVPVATAAPQTATAVKAKPAKSGSGRRWLGDLLLSFLLIAAILVAVGSTLVAKKAIAERDALKADLATSQQAVDAIVHAAASSSRLKGPANAEARKEIFGPAVAYYKQVGAAHRTQPETLDQAANAYYRAAGLQTRMATSEMLNSIRDATEVLRLMGEAQYDAARYPSLNQAALQITSPMEWAMVKDKPLAQHAPGLILTFTGLDNRLTQLQKQYPQSTVLRDDLAGLQRISATLQTAVPDRHPFAIIAWTKARDLLEGLLREQPGNVDYQNRLLEALNGAANLQKQNAKLDEAVANLKRAVELRQQMADANPEDKELAAALTKAKTDLEKIQPAGSSDSAPATDSAAAQ